MDVYNRIKERYKYYTKKVDEGFYNSEMDKINYDPITWIMLKLMYDEELNDIDSSTIIDETINIIMDVDVSKNPRIVDLKENILKEANDGEE